jgi:hypothetical protein
MCSAFRCGSHDHAICFDFNALTVKRPFPTIRTSTTYSGFVKENRAMITPMLQRTPKRLAKRREMARYRERNKRGVPYVGGDPPPALIDVLIDTDWLKPDEAGDPRAIFDAMCQALLSTKKIVGTPTQHEP